MPIPAVLSAAAKGIAKKALAKMAAKTAAKSVLSKAASKSIASKAAGKAVTKNAVTSAVKSVPQKLASKGLQKTVVPGNKLDLGRMADPKVNPPAPQSGLSKLADKAKEKVKESLESTEGQNQEKPQWSERGPVINSLSNIPSQDNAVYLEQIEKLKQMR